MFGKKHTEASKEKIRIKRWNQVIPTKDTKPEKFMQKLLTDTKIEFEKHKPILGQPDIFIKPNICIFVDGDYPHANPNPFTIEGRHYPGFKPDDHIQGKIYAKGKWASDSSITKRLKDQKMIVERLWQSELEQNPEKCLQKIIKIIKESKPKS